MSGALQGIGVLVTRPAHQADKLMSLVTAAGGQPILFPAIEIQPVQDSALARLLSRLGDYDIAIFISANAVTFGFDAIAAHHANLPQRLQLAAVGAATASAMTARGYRPDFVPPRDYRSESLLALDALRQVDNKKIIIFRGQGGREILADALRKRGAGVDYAECYRRLRPEADSTLLETRWVNGEIDVVTATSIEGVTNLHEMLSDTGKRLLKQTPTVVVSRRMADHCRRLGLTGHILLAREPGDAAIVAAIETWHRRQKTL